MGISSMGVMECGGYGVWVFGSGWVDGWWDKEGIVIEWMRCGYTTININVNRLRFGGVFIWKMLRSYSYVKNYKIHLKWT